MKAIIWTVLFSMSLAGAMISPSVAQEMPQAPGSVPSNRIGDSDLRAFAKAYIEFEKIRGEYEPKLNTANSPQEKGAVEQEAVAKLNKALEHGRHDDAAIWRAISNRKRRSAIAREGPAVNRGRARQIVTSAIAAYCYLSNPMARIRSKRVIGMGLTAYISLPSFVQAIVYIVP